MMLTVHRLEEQMPVKTEVLYIAVAPADYLCLRGGVCPICQGHKFGKRHFWHYGHLGYWLFEPAQLSSVWLKLLMISSNEWNEWKAQYVYTIIYQLCWFWMNPNNQLTLCWITIFMFQSQVTDGTGLFPDHSQHFLSQVKRSPR